MRSIKRPVLLVLAVPAGLMLILVAFIFIRYMAVTSRMSPAESGMVNDSVYVIKDSYVNVYLFKAGSTFISFDAGIKEERLGEACRELGIDPGMVTTVFLTHCDDDHSGGVDLFTEAELYMHKDEEALARGEISRMGPVRYKWKHGGYKLLQDGELFEIEGVKIEVIHTPGHTPGSVCYIVNDSYLVSGDNLIYSDGKYEHFLELVNMDTEEQLESLKKLPPPESFTYILSAHYGVSGIEMF